MTGRTVVKASWETMTSHTGDAQSINREVSGSAEISDFVTMILVMVKIW